MALKEYKPGTAFAGVVGRTIDVSQPAWPQPLRAREGAPTCCSSSRTTRVSARSGCYGRPIDTPNIDGWPRTACCFNNMHTTALCSPTRSCILTGRNHHSNAMSCITEGSTGYPGSNGLIPFENGFLSEILLQHGYNTYAVGKWHLTPATEKSAAGPYDRWPLGRGFERFYGFLGADTHQYYPDLAYDNHQVEPPKTPEEGYHFTEDLADKAIGFIADAKQVAPDKPFFMYFARARPRAAPRAQGVGGQVQGEVRYGLGQVPRDGLRAPEKARHSRRTPSSRATTPTSSRGTSARPRRRRSTPV